MFEYKIIRGGGGEQEKSEESRIIYTLAPGDKYSKLLVERDLHRKLK